MPEIVMYSSMWCPFCHRAKSLLASKNAPVTEIVVDGKRDLREEMIRKAGGLRTVPQIFIDGEHIGGSDDLHDLERAGKLDRKLGLAA